MSGELLVQTFSAERYQEALPAIRELSAARKLSPSSLRLLRLALAAPLPEPNHLQFGRQRLQRVVLHEGLDPRVFLSPGSHIDALNTFLRLFCFEDAGCYDLVSDGGESWAVLEPAVVYLYDDAWLGRLLDGELDVASPAAVPAECPTVLLDPSALDQFLLHLGTVLAEPSVQGHARANIERLGMLAERARKRPHVGLAFTILL